MPSSFDSIRLQRRRSADILVTSFAHFQVDAKLLDTAFTDKERAVFCHRTSAFTYGDEKKKRDEII